MAPNNFLPMTPKEQASLHQISNDHFNTGEMFASGVYQCHLQGQLGIKWLFKPTPTYKSLTLYDLKVLIAEAQILLGIGAYISAQSAEGATCDEPPYFHIFISHHILSGLVLSMNCFIICLISNHTPFHYQSRTHVRHAPNTLMTSYMPTPHGLPIVYTPLTLVAHMVVSVLLLTCSQHLYLMVL